MGLVAVLVVVELMDCVGLSGYPDDVDADEMEGLCLKKRDDSNDGSRLVELCKGGGA